MQVIVKLSTRASAHGKGVNTFRGTMEPKDELFSTGFAFAWNKQHERNLKRTSKPVKERCNDIVRQNMFTELSEKSSLRLYIEFKETWITTSVIQNAIIGRQDVGRHDCKQQREK